jgi:hypothetical protein
MQRYFFVRGGDDPQALSRVSELLDAVDGAAVAGCR